MRQGADAGREVEKRKVSMRRVLVNHECRALCLCLCQEHTYLRTLLREYWKYRFRVSLFELLLPFDPSSLPPPRF
jgi:hypothetical protein